MFLLLADFTKNIQSIRIAKAAITKYIGSGRPTDSISGQRNPTNLSGEPSKMSEKSFFLTVFNRNHLHASFPPVTFSYIQFLSANSNIYI